MFERFFPMELYTVAGQLQVEAPESASTGPILLVRDERGKERKK